MNCSRNIDQAKAIHSLLKVIHSLLKVPHSRLSLGFFQHLEEATCSNLRKCKTNEWTEKQPTSCKRQSKKTSKISTLPSSKMKIIALHIPHRDESRQRRHHVSKYSSGWKLLPPWRGKDSALCWREISPVRKSHEYFYILQ